MQIEGIDLLANFDKYLSFSDKTPCFLFEKNLLVKQAKQYLKAINKSSYPIYPFYAIKSNHYKNILSTLNQLGYGLDASSRRELELCIQSGAKDVIYTGPGKIPDDMAFAMAKFKNLTIHLDSFGELEQLKALSTKKEVNICVRINTAKHGGWRKFGIKLSDLRKFYDQTKTSSNIKFSGIHFHNSWNTDSTPYIKTLKSLDIYLKNNFSKRELQDFNILDIGGGLYQDRVEGYLSVSDDKGSNFFEHLNGYNLVTAQGMDTVTHDIDAYIKKSVFNSISGLKIFTEPGRWLNTHCMHILLKVLYVKSKKLVILDGGTENFGFVTAERFYYPLYNITRPNNKEIKMVMAGSLCSIDDIWGYYCYSKEIKPGDVIFFPFQGSYTYSYAKEFIKPIPQVYVID